MGLNNVVLLPCTAAARQRRGRCRALRGSGAVLV